jgi:hypothetical protein
MTDDKRLIEDYLPIEAISRRGVSRERSVRKRPYPHVALVVAAATAGGLPSGRVRNRSTGIRYLARRCATVRLATNEWYKATQLGDSYWLYVVWDPLGKPDAEPLRIQNPAKHLDHAKKEVVAARYFDIPAAAVENAARTSKVKAI